MFSETGTSFAHFITDYEQTLAVKPSLRFSFLECISSFKGSNYSELMIL